MIVLCNAQISLLKPRRTSREYNHATEDFPKQKYVNFMIGIFISKKCQPPPPPPPQNQMVVPLLPFDLAT